MAIQTTFRRGNTLQHSTFTGALAELTVDTDKKVVVVHDGSTVGGFPMIDQSSLTTANTTEVTNLYFTNARSRQAISVTGAGSYDTANGIITITGGVTSVAGAVGAISNAQIAQGLFTSGLLSTNTVPEGANLYHTDERVWANVVYPLFVVSQEANAAFFQANVAFNQGNINYGLASGYANVAIAQANVAFAQANTAFVGANIATNYATSAFAEANAAYAHASTAFAQANVAFNTGNINYGLASGYANVAFAQANTAFAQANVAFDTSNANFISANTYVNTRLLTKANVADLTTSNVAEGSNLYYLDSRAHSNVITYLTGNDVKTISGNLNITGNLNISGTITTFTSNVVEIQDPMIYLGTNNTGDVVDIGFVAHFTNPYYQHTGFVRDASDGVWKLFANIASEPSNNTLDFSNATYSSLKVGTLFANIVEAANVVANVVTTSEIKSEGGTTHVYTSDIGIVSIDVNGGQTKFYNSSIEVPGDVLGGTFGGNRVSLTGNYASLQGLRNNRVQIQTGNAGSVNNTWIFSGVDGSLTVPGNIVPASNLVHNLGSPTNRWKDLYLSGNTINLGEATISAIGTGISLPPSSSIGGQTISSFGGSYNDLTNKPANVISFSNTNISYFDTHTILSVDKSLYRSGVFTYNIEDDENNFYATFTQSFIHKNNVLSYSNVIATIGTPGVHEGFITLDAGITGNISLLTSFNNYAINYFGENYSGTATINVKGSVSLIEV